MPSLPEERVGLVNPETVLPRPVGPVLQAEPRRDSGDMAAAMQEIERRAAEGRLSPEAAGAWEELKRRRGLQGAQAPAGQPPDTEGGLWRPLGVAATGFNRGLASWVDALNDGLSAVGLPMEDEPFMGTAFVEKYLGGAQFQPQGLFEHVLQRAGFEIGATAPVAAGTAVVAGRAVAKQAAGALPSPAGHTQLDAIKNLPRALAEQLAELGAEKLVALETALAAGAGAGAGLVSALFPQGGAMAEFVGELLGSFSPSIVLGLTQWARRLVHGVGATILGLETKEETTRRLGRALKDAATPEQIEEGIRRAEELKREITPGAEGTEGFHLTAGEAIRGGSVTATQIAQEKSSVALSAKLKDQRRKNVQAVVEYFQATAPPGETTRLVEALSRKRANDEALIEVGVARTQAKIDAIRGDLSVRAARTLNEMEARMFAADQRIEQRLSAIGQFLGKKERGMIVRQEYLDEVARFRERSRANYAELDALGHAELPVEQTSATLARLQDEFPAQVQVIRKISPTIDRAITQLGRDYELIARAEKAQADLEITPGSSPDLRGGYRVFQEQEGQGSTPRVIGVPSTYPEWYRSLTRGANALSRETIEKALDTIRTGREHGLRAQIIEHVKQAILGDREFRTSPFFEPVMDELAHRPSTDMSQLRQLRSDLLALARKARSKDDRVQNYVLNELLNGVDADLDQLLPDRSPIAAFYPEHGALYRQVSADYRAGVETLLSGTANKLRRVTKYGDYAEYDESVPALFWRNETTMADFARALGSRQEAHRALKDYATEHFFTKAVFRNPETGKLQVDPLAAEEWLKQHAGKLQAFPDLPPLFRDLAKMQEQANQLHEQVTVFQRSREGERALRRRVDAERRPGDFSQLDLSRAEAEMKQIEEAAARTRHEWQASVAELFMKEKASSAGYRIATAEDPIAEYEKIYQMVSKSPDAVAGLNRAVWEGLSEKLAPRLTGVYGEVNLGVLHTELQRWIDGHGKIMRRVLGDENFARLETAAEAIQRIASGGRAGSDTAIALQVKAALASTWLSRGWAVMTGRVPAGYGVAERVMQRLISTWETMTRQQQEAILLESFFDPKVFQTMVNAAQYGPNSPVVQHQLRAHLHLLNLGEPAFAPSESSRQASAKRRS